MPSNARIENDQAGWRRCAESIVTAAATANSVDYGSDFYDGSDVIDISNLQLYLLVIDNSRNDEDIEYNLGNGDTTIWSVCPAKQHRDFYGWHTERTLQVRRTGSTDLPVVIKVSYNE